MILLEKNKIDSNSAFDVVTADVFTKSRVKYQTNSVEKRKIDFLNQTAVRD